jgi:hypothetical protein
VGRNRSAGGGLQLRARARARVGAAEGLPRHPADRRLRRLQERAGATGGTGDKRGDGTGVTLAHCWAHCRRRFFDIAKAGPAPIAREALQRIAALYEIEAEIRGKSAAERQAARQVHSKPLVEALKLWFEQRATELPRKSALAKAIGEELKPDELRAGYKRM